VPGGLTWQGPAPDHHGRTKAKRPKRQRGLSLAPIDNPVPYWLGGAWKFAGRWVYTDLSGAYHWEVVRCDGPVRPDGKIDKNYFPGRRPNASDSLISWGLPPREFLLPYRVSELVSGVAAGHRVFIAEGEKSADRLYDAGEIATTCQGGSGRWRETPDPQRFLVGCTDVRIIIDRDEAGLRWADDVSALLALVGIKPTRWQSKTKGPGQDVVDHLKRYRLDELVPM
jgi:hypothetical protein